MNLQSAVQESTINPLDYIIADLDGVVVLPSGLAKQVLELVPKIVEADQKCAEAIRGGATVQQAFATHRGK